MSSEVKIPYGYKQVPAGERAKYRDGVLGGDGKFRRMRRPKGGWPVVGPEQVIIRRCTVEQSELPMDSHDWTYAR